MNVSTMNWAGTFSNCAVVTMSNSLKGTMKASLSRGLTRMLSYGIIFFFYQKGKLLNAASTIIVVFCLTKT